jgi:nitrilase
MTQVKVAIVQKPPVMLDRDGTIKKTLAYIEEVAGEGANLAVFPETYIPGYPFWAWLVHPSKDFGVRNEIYGQLVENSVDIGRGDLEPLQEAAASKGIQIIIGVNENSPDSKTSLYNALVTIGSNGSLLNVHRKLVPTYVERNVWAPGDGAGLRVIETDLGRIGGLICWENLMPLARYSLYAQGLDIYVVSTWDSGDPSVATMRHIAREARSWLVCSGFALHKDDVPEDFPGRERILDFEGEWVNDGDSLVVAPGGQMTMGPLRQEYGILYADIDTDVSRQQSWYMDTAGHYNRPDVFDVRVDRRRRTAIEFVDAEKPPVPDVTEPATEAEGLG